jgi:hypothetical protein
MQPMARPAASRLIGALRAGLVKGVWTGWFLVRIIVPLSAGVALLDWTGTLARLGAILSPVMRIVGLPGEAAVAIVSGWFAGVYGGVAAASMLNLTSAQTTVLALMVLTAHNLVVESTVQSRSGTSGPMVTVVRLTTALVLGAIVWQVIGRGEPGPGLMAHASRAAAPVEAAAGATVQPAAAPAVAAKPFAEFAAGWAIDTGRLLLKIFLIVIALMVAMELMRTYGLIDLMQRPMRPFMRFLGLSERVTFLWLTATFLGVGYGAGLIVQEARTHGRFRPGDLRDLHVSIGISHSLLEDTLLCVAIGANPFWILLPRPLAAAAAVRMARGIVPVRPVAGVEPAPETP